MGEIRRTGGATQSRLGGCPPEAEMLDLLGELVGYVKGYLQQVLRPYELAAPCAMALRQIDGAISMKELGLKVRCDPSFVTAIADGLEERGLARREIDPEDRRIKNLVLTDKGVALQGQLEREFFRNLPGIRRLSAEEREAFLGLLRTMVAAEHEALGTLETDPGCGSAAMDTPAATKAAAASPVAG